MRYVRALLTFAALFSGLCALPAGAASPEDVRKVVTYMLHSHDKQNGLIRYKRIGPADGVSIWFIRNKKWYQVYYPGSYDVDYERTAKGAWIIDRPIVGNFPVERRELYINVTPAKRYPYGCPTKNMHDSGLVGRPYSARDTDATCYENPPKGTSYQRWNELEKTYDSESLQEDPKTVALSKQWQEEYDNAIKDILVHFNKYPPLSFGG